METLQMILSATPASLIVALLVMPWLTVSLMHAVGAGTRVAFEDNWKTRAQAAVQWAGAIAQSTTGNAHIQSVARGTAIDYAGNYPRAAAAFLHAA